MALKIKEVASRDSIIKNILTSTDAGRDYLSKIVCKVLGFSYEDFTFTLIHPVVSVNENIVNSEIDLAIQNDEVIVNIETNSSKGSKIERKNNNYKCQLVLRQTKKFSDYTNKYKKVYQINLNTYGVTKDKRFVVISKILDIESHEEIHPMFEIYDINLAKILDKDYTIVKEDKESLEKLLYLLICNDKEKMNEVYDGDEFMAKIIREVNAQADEFDKLLFYNREILEDEYSIEEAKEEARKEALAEGREQSKLNIAKAMLSENCDIKLIAKVTNLTYDNVMKLKEEQ